MLKIFITFIGSVRRVGSRQFLGGQIIFEHPGKREIAGISWILNNIYLKLRERPRRTLVSTGLLSTSPSLECFQLTDFF